MMRVEIARSLKGFAKSERPISSSKGWPGLERSDYPGGVSHKTSWEMYHYRMNAAYQQAIPELDQSSVIVCSEQTSCACGTEKIYRASASTGDMRFV